MADVTWEDPPPIRRATRNVWKKRLEPLMDSPGRWARLTEGPKLNMSTTASGLRRAPASGLAIPPGRWEFACRAVPGDDDKRRLYGRYLGKEEA